MKRAPSVYSGSIHIVPPICSMISWQMDRPNPVPWAPSFSFSNRLNICPCFSKGMPQPVSVTENRTISSDVFFISRVIIPSVVNFVALMRRLIRTCCKRESSVNRGKVSNVVRKRTPACVCFTFSTVSMTFRQIMTASHSLKLNVSFPISRLDRSMTSLMSLSSSSEFC